MIAAVRVLSSIVVSLIFALAAIIGVELLSNVFHPLPADASPTREAMCLHVANYPQWILAVVVVLWGGIALASTWIAARIGNRITGTLIGALLLAAALANLAMLPYPLWFKVLTPLAFLAAIVVGVSSSRPAAQARTIQPSV